MQLSKKQNLKLIHPTNGLAKRQSKYQSQKTYKNVKYKIGLGFSHLRYHKQHR